MKLPKGGGANSLSQGEEEFGPSAQEVTTFRDVGTKISCLGAATSEATMGWGQGAKSDSLEVRPKTQEPRDSFLLLPVNSNHTLGCSFLFPSSPLHRPHVPCSRVTVAGGHDQWLDLLAATMSSPSVMTLFPNKGHVLRFQLGILYHSVQPPPCPNPTPHLGNHCCGSQCRTSPDTRSLSGTKGCQSQRKR